MSELRVFNHHLWTQSNWGASQTGRVPLFRSINNGDLDIGLILDDSWNLQGIPNTPNPITGTHSGSHPGFNAWSYKQASKINDWYDSLDPDIRNSQATKDEIRSFLLGYSNAVKTANADPSFIGPLSNITAKDGKSAEEIGLEYWSELDETFPWNNRDGQPRG